MTTPLILDVKCNSLDDGPGVRTVIFFKGCPLSCVWCHNPESKIREAELSFDAESCIDCGRCRAVCQAGALDKATMYYVDHAKCTLCYACVDVCPAKALTRAGNALPVEEILKTILSDKVFYDISGGGVTLSGGEATLYPAYVGELLLKCGENGVHTLLETCGMFDFGRFSTHLLPYLDTVYFDIKLFDADAHRKYCGADNGIILRNLETLAAYAREHALELLPRTPLIPDITDTDENLSAIAALYQRIGIRKTSLLPYNPTWYPKNAKLGLPAPNMLADCVGWQSPEKVAHCKSIFQNGNIEIV